jgi:hypothetical protein
MKRYKVGLRWVDSEVNGDYQTPEMQLAADGDWVRYSDSVATLVELTRSMYAERKAWRQGGGLVDTPSYRQLCRLEDKWCEAARAVAEEKP